jgi:hypothetical protein
MWRLPLVLLVALTGCGYFSTESTERHDDPAGAPDAAAAAVDAKPYFDAYTPIERMRVPFTTTGTTPAGSLEVVQFIEIYFIGGHCPGTYFLNLYATDNPYELAVARFEITPPPKPAPPPTGTIFAEAFAAGSSTNQARFEIVQLDNPGPDDMGPPTLRIAGRMTLSLDVWTVDFTVDSVIGNAICLLL